MIRIAVLVSGRGTNMESIIKNTQNGYIDGSVVLVISDREDAPALEKARRLGIEAKFIYPGKGKYTLMGKGEERYIDILMRKNVDLVCLAGFMRILKTKFLRTFKGKIMNIHPSLLPSFKGLNVQKRALEYGVKFSGCTIHFVDESVDGGPIILQAVVPIFQDDNVNILSERILKEEHRIYAEAIKLFSEDALTINGRKVNIKQGGSFGKH